MQEHAVDVRIATQEAVMLVTGEAERVSIEPREALAVPVGVADSAVVQSGALFLMGHPIGCRLEEVDRKPRVEAVPDIQTLGDRVEGKGDQRPVERACLAGVPEGSVQQRIADSASLMVGRDEQLREKPEVAASPAEREACDLAVDLRHPQTVRIIPKG